VEIRTFKTCHKYPLFARRILRRRQKEEDKKKERAQSIIRIMAWTNFVITGAAIVAVASLMRSDIRTSTSMLRRNVKTIRKMMEDVSNGESIGEVVKKGEEEIAKKLKK